MTIFLLLVCIQNLCESDNTSAYVRVCVPLQRCVSACKRENILLSHLAHLIYSISSGNSCCDIVTLSKLYWLAGPFRGAQVANEMWQLNELLVLKLNRVSRMISLNTGRWTNKGELMFSHTHANIFTLMPAKICNQVYEMIMGCSSSAAQTICMASILQK